MSGVTELRASKLQSESYFSSGTPAEDVKACPLKKHWIEIELLDWEQKPIVGAEYWVQLTTGEIKTGTFDATGIVRFDGIPEGECIVQFPGTEKYEHREAVRTSWIELELLDEWGKPMPEQRYEIEGADGCLIKGQLDKQGFQRVVGLAPGVCTVKWLDQDATAFVSAEEEPDAEVEHTAGKAKWTLPEEPDDYGGPAYVGYEDRFGMHRWDGESLVAIPDGADEGDGEEGEELEGGPAYVGALSNSGTHVWRGEELAELGTEELQG